MNVKDTLKKHYREAKGELTGKAVSKARVVLPMRDFDSSKMAQERASAPRPTNVAVRMLTKDRMVFFNDGSLRHLDPQAGGKAARRKVRRAQHAARQAAKRS